MTDNRTTELLRKLLDERGVKYDVKALRETEWTVNGVIWHANEYDGKLNVYVRNNDMLLTPEQAIAATLGSEREKAFEELVRDMWREITTCPDYPIPPCMTRSICDRIRELGIEVSA